jgi:hypothetical protein
MKAASDFIAFYSELDGVRRQVVDHSSTMREIRKGDVIIRQGEAPDAVYAIEKGVVEVVREGVDLLPGRSTAYLSVGDIFGEVDVIIDKPRTATVRACEPVRLRKFTANQFTRLIERIPAFSLFLSLNLAQRLCRATGEHYYISCCIDFRGNTENFDLLMVFQTIQSGGRTGELQLTHANGDVAGSFFFSEGKIQFARYGHLSGIEAVWQLLIEEKPASAFAFQLVSKPTFKHDKSQAIAIGASELLLQGAAHRRQFRVADPALKNPEQVLSRLADVFNWENPGTVSQAKALWERVVKQPQSLEELWRVSNLSWATLAEIVAEMRKRGFVELAS